MARRRRPAAPESSSLAEVVSINRKGGFFTEPPTAPDRDTRPVDQLAGSYRVVSLYRYLRCDSHRRPDGASFRPNLDAVDGLRARLFNALHAGRHCDDARVCHDWDGVGEPVVLPVWRVAADHFTWVDEIDHVPWMQPHSEVLWFEVTPDDIVTPAVCPSWGPEFESYPGS
jgi:hypothetical protein